MGAKRRLDATEKQLEVWHYLVEFVAAHGYQPTRGEIAERFGVTPKAILDRLAQLANKGYLEFAPSGAERCLRLKAVRFTPAFDESPPEPRAAPVERLGAGPAIRADMAWYLREVENEWTALAVLAEAAGVDLDTAKRALAGAPPGEFEDGLVGRKKLWRLLGNDDKK